MKVLLLSNLYPSRRDPTRGMFHYNLFGALADLCEVRLIAPLPWWSRARHPRDWFVPPREHHTGIDVLLPTYWSVPRVTSLHARGMYASLRPHIARLHREFPFDIILAAWVYPDAAAAARLAQDYNCPLVVKVLGSDINEIARHGSLRDQIIQTLTQAQRILAVSNALKERVIDLGIPREKVVMHHNGVNGDQFTLRDAQEVRKRLGLPQDRKLVCYVGNFKPEKGVDVLIEAMGCLHRDGNREIEVVMVGSGPMEEKLRATVRLGGFEDRVRFVGRKLHAEIPDWIAACDVFCLPSRREGCPNVVLEGLASGRPVVATAVGGVPELINADNGILVPSEQPEALAGALKDAVSRTWNPTVLRQSVENLSWEEIGRAVHGVLEDSLAEYRASSISRVLTGSHVRS